MSRANVVSFVLAASLIIGTNATASGALPGDISIPAQSTPDSGIPQNKTEMAMNVPLLIYVDARAQVRSIQHSQRLPADVNDLLWQSVRHWTKTSAVINGRHEGAQLLMNVILHAKPQPDGKTNVYFTLASEGPVLRGYWFMQGNHLYGHCSISAGNMAAGDGGKGTRCYSLLAPVTEPSAAGAAAK
ncbi:hypothetical protein [Dyella nitratireducens]|uniref:Uncharacterized protein n=1 Tax=Dyella nitratireducens TaxID=1849580 RepID=A0ABQ1FLS6_9GAMM|nr:hypothetical protein [Dyella nitratireducens]GGA19861.1 hypothetical protein GCM10010981_04840 [Dyella nitratireducens]GLQ44454.1 hypothetical protein GCM10007902_43040 [Dyella nitratireducens]